MAHLIVFIHGLNFIAKYEEGKKDKFKDLLVQNEVPLCLKKGVLHAWFTFRNTSV